MTTPLDYALLAGAAYFSTRNPINRFPIPNGWSEDTNQRRADDQTGFEARTFQNNSEIVISYAGTYASDIRGDGQADINLAAGVFNDQILQAARYYLDVKAANSGATITLTGHSLGGGLAALVGVFFGVNATTFDQGPFAAAARSFSDRDVADSLKTQLLGQGYTNTALTGLTSFITQRQSSGAAIPNADKVRNIIVAGEILSLPGVPGDRIGQTAASDIIANTATGASSIDLHSQALLAAFLQSQVSNAGQSLNKVTDKLPDLLKLIFDATLYQFTTDKTNDKDPNFLEFIVNHQAGRDPKTGASIQANDMVTRFTADLWKLTPTGGLTMDDKLVNPPYSTQLTSNFISKALMAFAMQKYYTETDHSRGLFSTAGITNGVSFSMDDVATKWDDAKGKRYFDSYMVSEYNGLSPTDRGAIVSMLPNVRDWYVQAGTGAMVATKKGARLELRRNFSVKRLHQSGAENFRGKVSPLGIKKGRPSRRPLRCGWVA